MSLRDVKRAMEVMVWFYENFDNFSPLIQDEDGDGDGDDDYRDDNNGFESKNREELKDERPRYSQERPIIKDKLFSREDEPHAAQKESPFLTDWRPASLIEERRSPKKERPLFEEAKFSSKERPAVRRERLALKEGRPTLKKAQSPLKEEQPIIKEERSVLENVLSVLKEERSTLKGKRHIIKKTRSPGNEARYTFNEEPPTLKKEGPTQLGAFCRRVRFLDPEEITQPEEPDLLLTEEIFGAASQVKPVFFTDRRLNKYAFNYMIKSTT